MQKLLRIKDVALALEVTPQTIHNMLNSGRFPVDPIPGTKPRRWRAADIERWLSGTGTTPAAPAVSDVAE